MARFVYVAMLILGALSISCVAQKASPKLPIVTAASVPIYPRLALVARIHGIVKIRVKTDGKKVISLDSESGPPILVKAAKENIQTWEFEEHKPADFVTTYEFRIMEPAQCNFDNGMAVLHLPSEIQVTAGGIETCDPVEESKPGQHESGTNQRHRSPPN